MLSRRLFLGGMLAGAAAPAVVRAESLMKIAAPKIEVPSTAGLPGQVLRVSESGELEWAKQAVMSGEIGHLEHFRIVTFDSLPQERDVTRYIRADDDRVKQLMESMKKGLDQAIKRNVRPRVDWNVGRRLWMR